METATPNTYGECRCCLSKGQHKDIMKEYYTNGVREIYYNMFMDCFNLYMSTTSSISTLICSSCVLRLRDASSFRAMAVTTERRLLAASQETVFVNVGEHTDTEVDIKLETPVHNVQIKEEASDSDRDYDSDIPLINHSQHHSELPELASDVAKLVARFPRGSLRALPTRDSLYTSLTAYVRHLDQLRGKLILPRMLTKLVDQQEIRKTKVRKTYITEKYAHIINASTILECSNVTPFKSKSRSGFPCFYCRNIFDNLEQLKNHQSNEHKKSEAKKILSTYGAESLVVYVDVTDLKCLICQTGVPNLNELKSHLTKTHLKKMHLEFTDRIIPFKLSENNVYECQLCGFSFETFGSIERHMNTHFRNYVCKDCGTGFVTKYRLKVHIKSMHVGGSFPCEICKKVYTTQQKYKNHVDTVHKLVKRFKCPKCPERFSEYFRRQKHLVQIHNLAPLQYKCNVCDKSFDRRYTLSRHMKRDHLEERDYQCQLCSYKCFTNNELTVHMIKHNGERIFECAVCKKSYARKKTLKEHMRIHNNDRRFACAVCGQAFVQKCSLKGHIKTHHIEYSLQSLE
ncbi:PR domain zinc finger protein 5-like [Cydia splendana]|uniref:PR domain zinc finger protein 5-like n=1 Tax=Cydia splendana TaxID=1100963 RepID=UPI00213CA1BA